MDCSIYPDDKTNLIHLYRFSCHLLPTCIDPRTTPFALSGIVPHLYSSKLYAYNIQYKSLKKHEIIAILILIIIMMMTMIGTSSILKREFNNIKHQHKCEINLFREKADYPLFFL